MPRSDTGSTAAGSTGSRPSKLGKFRFGSLAGTFKGAFKGSKQSETESSVRDQETQAAADRVTADESHDGRQSAIGPDTTSHAKTTTVTPPPIEEDDMAIGPAPPRY